MTESFPKLEELSNFFPGKREVEQSMISWIFAYLIWIFFEHSLFLASHGKTDQDPF